MKIELGSGVIILTILFVLLKAFDKIDWSWWYVFSPLWISALLVLSIILIIWVTAVYWSNN